MLALEALASSSSAAQSPKASDSLAATAPCPPPTASPVDNLAFARLEARVASLEASASCPSAQLPTSDPAHSSASEGAEGTSSSRKRKLPTSPSGTAPTPSTPTSSAAPVARAPGAGSAAGAASYAEVVGKGKKSTAPLTVDDINAASNPIDLLLAKKREGIRVTKEVVVTQLTAPLSVRAQARPYLSWRSLLKAVTGTTPLMITLIHPRRALAFWDATDSSVKEHIHRSLLERGFLLPSACADVENQHVLRAYLGGYFPLLRQTVLQCFSLSSAAWVLDKAEEKWRRSPDKVLRRMWLRRIADDRRSLGGAAVGIAGDGLGLSPSAPLDASDGTVEVQG